MTDTNKHDNNIHAPKIEQATAFTSWQNLCRGEAQRFLDESSAAMERYHSESERMFAESSRLFAAQSRAMQEASCAVVTGLRAMMG